MGFSGLRNAFSYFYRYLPLGQYMVINQSLGLPRLNNVSRLLSPLHSRVLPALIGVTITASVAKQAFSQALVQAKQVSKHYHAFRQHCKQRPSAGACADDEKTENVALVGPQYRFRVPCIYEGYKGFFRTDDLERPPVYSLEDQKCHNEAVLLRYQPVAPAQEEAPVVVDHRVSNNALITRHAKQNRSSGSAAPDDEEDWWQGCQSDFWRNLGQGSKQIGRTVYLGSTYLLGGDITDPQRSRTKVVRSILGVLPGNEVALNIQEQIQAPITPTVSLSANITQSVPLSTTIAQTVPLSTTIVKTVPLSSTITQTVPLSATVAQTVPLYASIPAPPISAPGIEQQTRLDDEATESAREASSEEKEETLDSMMKQYKAMCIEYQAYSESLIGLASVEAGDLSTAVEHLHTSCLLGSSSAAFNLGLCYETGRGVSLDKEKAVYFYKKAVSCDHSQACFNLALMHLEHCTDMPYSAPEEDNNSHLKQEGLALLEQAAALGLKEAQSYLGILLMESKDVTRALPFFKAAADQNDLDALYFLAMCYEQGWGVEVNECRAATLYSQGASGGHAMATYNLGVFNELGLGGMLEDRACAKDLYQKASDLGSVEATHCLEEMRTKDNLDTFTETYKPKQSTKEPLSISLSVSTPAFTYHLPQTQDFDSNFDHLERESNEIRSFKILFDPGGEGFGKIKFSLGRGESNDSATVDESDNGSDNGSDVMSPRSSWYDSGSGDEAPFSISAFHKSSTTPRFEIAHN